jgi:hypothetical protein
MNSNSVSKRLAYAFSIAAFMCGSAAYAADVVLPGDLSGWTSVGSAGSMAPSGDIVASPLANTQYGYVTTAESTEFQVSPLTLKSGGKGSGIEHNGSKITSNIFSAIAGQTLSMSFNFASTDGKGYDDYAWARVINSSDDSLVAWLFAAQSTNSNTKGIVPGSVLDKSAFDPDQVISNYKDFSFTSKTAEDPIDWSALKGSSGFCWKDNAEGCGFTGWLDSSITLANSGSYRVEIGVVNWGDGAYDSGLAFDFRGLTNSQNVTAVPESETYALMLVGLCLVGSVARRRRAQLQ